MATTYSINLTSIIREDRLDAEYYSPRYLVVARQLDAVETAPLTYVAAVSDGNHAAISEDFSTDATDRYRYLRGQDLGGFFLGSRKPVYVSEASFDRMRASRIHAGDVLLTIVGHSVGAVSLVPEDAPDMVASCKIAALRPLARRIRPEYLAAFLSSASGQSQVARLTRGSAQPGLLLADMKHIRVPRLGSIEAEVADEVQGAWHLLRAARAALEEAKNWLPGELGYSGNASTEDPRGWLASHNSMILRRRWDAEYFAPRFVHHESKIRDLPAVTDLVPMRLCLRSITNGHTPLHHDLTVGKVHFLTAENIVDFSIDHDPKKRITEAQHELELGRTILHDGDVLFTIKGRIGDCAPVADLRFPTNVNQDVAVLRLKTNVHPYFFAGWYNSDLGRPFIRQAATGAINPFLGLYTLRTLWFPLIDESFGKSLGDEIEARVRNAIDKEADATARLRRTIRKVDDEITRRSSMS
jgi:hypothetical protein